MKKRRQRLGDKYPLSLGKVSSIDDVVAVVVIPVFLVNKKIIYGVVRENKGSGFKLGFPAGGIDRADIIEGSLSQTIVGCAQRELIEELFGGQSLDSEKMEWQIIGLFPTFSFSSEKENKYFAAVEVILPCWYTKKVKPGPEQEKVFLLSKKEILERERLFFHNHRRLIHHFFV